MTGQDTPYTTGEVRALIAPMFDQDPENISHWTIVMHTSDGKVIYCDSEASHFHGNEVLHAIQVTAVLAKTIRDLQGEIAKAHGWYPDP